MESQNLILPAKFEDLYSDENETDFGFNLTTFDYGSNYDTVTLVERLEEFSDNSNPLESQSLSHGDINNLYFWAIKEFPSLPLSLRGVFVDSLRDLAELVVTSGGEQLTAEKKKNAKKVLFYYIHMLCKAESSLKSKDAYAPLAMTAKSGKAKSTSNKSKSAGNEGFDWVALRRVCLLTLDKIVSFSLSVFWPMGLVEENFTTPVWRYALSLLEERPTGVGGLTQHDAQCRTLCVSVVSKCIAFFGSSASSGSIPALSSALLNALLKAEHMCAITAEILRMEAMTLALSPTQQPAPPVSPQNLPHNPLTQELLVEIAKMNVSGLSSSALKCLSLFLETYARVDTARFTLALPLIVQCVDSPAHQVRSAMLQSLGHVLAHIHRTLTLYDVNPSGSEDEYVAREKTKSLYLRQRDVLLDMLIERTHDTSPFTRTCLLKVWAVLVEAQAIPAKKVGTVSEVAVDRLLDKNAFVRRAAIALLTALVDANPFAARLEREIFEVQRQEIERVIEERLDVLSEKAGLRVDLQGEKEKESSAAGEKKEKEKTKKDTEDKKAIKRKRDSRDVPMDVDDEDNEKERESENKALSRREKTKRKEQAKQDKLLQAMQDGTHIKDEEQGEDDENDDLDEEELARDANQDEIMIEQRHKRDYVVSALELIAAIDVAIVRVSLLLDSKNVSDVVESVRFFSRAVNFQVNGALEKFKDAFKLVWHQDVSIRTELLNAFTQVYLTDGARENAVSLSPTEISLNLMRLIQHCTTSELVSLEAIVTEVFSVRSAAQSAVVDTQKVLDCLLMRASQCSQHTRRERRSLINGLPLEEVKQQVGNTVVTLCSDLAAALAAVNMIFSQPAPSLVSLSLIRALSHYGMGSAATKTLDYHAMRVSACCLARVFPLLRDSERDDEDEGESQRDEAFVQVVQALVAVLRLPLDATECVVNEWFSAAEEVTHAIYKLHPNPEEVLGSVVCLYHATLSCSAHCDAHTLAAQLYLLGHAAVCTVVYTESLAGQVKQRLRVSDNHTTPSHKTTENREKTKKTTKKTTGESSGDTEGEGDEEREGEAHDVADFAEAMGAQAALDAEHDALVFSLIEHDLVLSSQQGPQSALFAMFRPLVVYIVADDRGVFGEPLLRATAVLTLTRLMSVSSVACEQSLPLLFTVLGRERSVTIKSSVVVALGDLAFRFPNTLEPWTERLFNTLRDAHTSVRYNALQVVTHLVLNDMVKVKGHVKHVVLSLCDEDAALRDLARLFFIKLSERANNPLFNLFGDLISHFSRDPEDMTRDSGSSSSVQNDVLMMLSAEQFQTTFHFLFSFVQKDKQADLLFERLLLRLVAAETTRQRRNLAFCLAELTVTEKALKKLIESARNLKLALQDDEVFSHLGTVLQKAKKSRGPTAATADEQGESAPPAGAAAAATQIAKSVIEEAEKILNAVANNEEGSLFASSSALEKNESERDSESVSQTQHQSKARRVIGKAAKKATEKKSSATTTKTQAAKSARGRKKKVESDESSPDDEIDSESEREDEKPAVAAKKTSKKKPVIADSDEEAEF